jgi:hypothetical protein
MSGRFTTSKMVGTLICAMTAGTEFDQDLPQPIVNGERVATRELVKAACAEGS